MKKTILCIFLCLLSICSKNILSMHRCCRQICSTQNLTDAFENDNKELEISPMAIQKAEKQEKTCCILTAIGGSFIGTLAFTALITLIILRTTGKL